MPCNTNPPAAATPDKWDRARTGGDFAQRVCHRSSVHYFSQSLPLPLMPIAPHCFSFSAAQRKGFKSQIKVALVTASLGSSSEPGKAAGWIGRMGPAGARGRKEM